MIMPIVTGVLAALAVLEFCAVTKVLRGLFDMPHERYLTGLPRAKP